jgi:uncharacterized protein involved in type VI secretion and phage assembly
MKKTEKMDGVVVGIVKDLDDDEHQGRIRVQFPWLGETPLSAWAPVAAALAGKKRGAFLMPEKDDEVLVAFERGDFDHPFIIGFLWNGADAPPETTNQNRVILTPGGHTLRFEDKEGDRRVILRSSGGHQIALDDAGKKLTVTTKGGLSLTMDDSGPSITLKGGQRMITMENGKIEFT